MTSHEYGCPGGNRFVMIVSNALPYGCVIALALLVLHDAALLVELALVDRAEQVAHAIRFEPQREIDGRGRHGLEVVGAVEVRRAVDVGDADFLQRPEILVVVVLAAVEHQMLEQVREAGLAGHLVLRADVVPDRDRDDRRFAVLVHDDAQAVVEIELVERNLRILGERRRRQDERRGTRSRASVSSKGPCAMVSSWVSISGDGERRAHENLTIDS